MADYGKTLKHLIDFSSVKMYLVAEAVGYDVSYISKWCNKGYLPSAKAVPKINSILSGLLAEDISLHCDLDEFNRQFDVQATGETLEAIIQTMLQDAYEDSGKKEAAARNGKNGNEVSIGARTLVHTNEIRRFFREEFTECLRTSQTSPENPLQILCTLDLCLFLSKVLPELTFPVDMDFHVKIAVQEDRLYRDHFALLPKLYSFLSLNCRVSFELFSNEKIECANTILIEDRMAAICSLDSDGRVMSVFSVSDPQTVHHMYSKILPLFNRSRLLLRDSDPIDFHRKGYRTDFYSRDHFQILLACGFEYLLPRDCWESVVETARKKYKNEHIALLVRRLQVTWEEIFEHGSIDFFVLKTALLRYMETGEIIFTDVVHRLTPEQRKSHVLNVLEVTRKNPNIVFYLIDDEKFQTKNPLAYLSVFNNREKAFLKNPNRYHCENGPFFYSIRDNNLISKMGEFFDDLKTTPVCSRYGHEELQAFYDKYSSLINRMIDL
ncbi:MAG: hypothetical protein Q4D81_09130 [Eubacteriales bacterium]|nr:hypothetical protein [Eubacteriales bacterium]